MILQGIEKYYQTKQGKYFVLNGLDLEIPEGKITCVLGKSGAGKTTLLNLLAGVSSYHGQVDSLPDSVGYVFQDNRLIPHLTVWENLQYVGGRYEVTQRLLSKFGLIDLADRRADKLSGGEKRRVALLRAFCVDSEMVLLDEPFCSLDTLTKEMALSETFNLIKTEKKTAVFVTHDLDEALAVADKIALLCEGKIAFEMALPKTDVLREYGSLVEERKLLMQKIREDVGRIL